MSITEKEKAMRALFSRRLGELITSHDLQQKDLADIIGVNESTVGKWLLEKAMPRMGTVQKLADYFGVPKSYFLEEKIKGRAAEALPPLSPRDERQIARDLEKMLADLDDKNDLAALGGTVEDAEDRELLRASLLTSMRLAKQIAKKKFTPKKYRKDDIE